MLGERRFVLLAAATLAVALVYSLWSARPLWSDVALALALLGAVRLTWRGWGVVPVGLRWPALALLGAQALAAAGSAEPLASSRAVLGLVAYGLIYLLLANLGAHGLPAAWRFRALLLAAQCLLAGLAAHWLAEGAHVWGYQLRYERTNSFALANLLLFPALLAGEARGLVLAEAAAVAWLSASRAGLAGLAAGVLAVWTGPSAARYRGALVVGGLALAVAVGARADLLADNDRLAMWGTAARMWASSPLTGRGPNTFKGFWLAGGGRTHSYGHAHNWPLTLAAETGALGLAAAGWLGWAFWRELRGRRGPWAAAARAGSAAVLIQSLADVPTSAPYIAVLWLALLELGLGADEQTG